MTSSIRCPHCNRQMLLANDSVGKQFRCPVCKNPFIAPVPEAPRPAAADVAPTSCPACGSKLLQGAVSCMDCGYLIGSQADIEGAPAICPNPACGVANSTTERYCARCTTPLPIAPGTVLHGQYKIRKLLAIGGFGMVYLAEDMKNGNKEVAIKDMICSDPQEFAIRLNFFQREAEILQMLANVPNVPRFHGLFVEEQTALLVMELLLGQDLYLALVARGGEPFPLDLVIEWGVQICDLLTTLHTMNPPILHRNINPSSFLLLEDGRSIRVADLSTARPITYRQTPGEHRVARIYTEGYAPPEQIVGKPEPRSDLFALAGTLYHLATGKESEGFYTAREINTRLADGSIPADQRWFFQLLEINLTEEPHNRYLSAEEIKTDLLGRQVTIETTCSRCGQATPIRRPFCRTCCEPLTELAPLACSSCGGRNRVGSWRCVHCGDRVG